MKKIAFFIQFLPVMVAYGSRGNVVAVPQDLRVFKAAQVAQKMNNLDHSLVLILLLVTLVFVLIFSIVLYQFIQTADPAWTCIPKVYFLHVELMILICTREKPRIPISA